MVRLLRAHPFGAGILVALCALGPFALAATPAAQTLVKSAVQITDGTNFQPTGDIAARTIHTTVDNASVAVTGTFFQGTQPVSLATLPALTTGAASIGTVGLNTGANVIGALTANQSVNQTQVNGIAVSTGLGIGDTGTQRVEQAQELTYFAGTTAKTATAAGTAPFFGLCGSASKTVRVLALNVTGTVATAAIYGDLVVKKTSTATSGGTATTLVGGPMDSTAAAATATAKYYTVLPTAGTSVGVVFTGTYFFGLTGTVTTMQPQPAIHFREVDGQVPVLSGTAQCLEASFGTTPTNAPTLTVSAIWTEK